MLKYIIFSILFFSIVSADDPQTVHTYVEHIHFEGDKYGSFKNDLVAVLSDGSEWKVHPNQWKKFEAWEPGETVEVGLCHSYYWFKREHKFRLCNLDRDEAVKVMLVKHANDPLVIVEASEVYYTCSQLCPVYNLDGDMCYHRHKPCHWRKNIMLCDGTKWIIKDNLSDFTVGRKIYMSRDEDAYLLITKLEREAVWSHGEIVVDND